IMRHLRIICFLAIALMLNSCHDIPDYPNDVYGNFDALWTIVDEHYCFFEEKDIDWKEVRAKYRQRLSDDMTSQEFFNVCAEMLNELRDGHVNLSSPFNTSYYHQWWSQYPQNYDNRLVEQYYFNFNYLTTGSIKYGILSSNVGYMRYPSFSSAIGEGNLDAILTHLATADGLIIDVRNNSGGDLTNVERLVGRFITERTLVGYISHKTGPGHSDFSEPRAFYYNPATDGHFLWGKPVVVLTNRSTFSAANNFVSIMKLIPGVTIVGATTGGGSGMPYSSELPCGWTIRCSACSVLDALGQTTENGVIPTPGCEVDLNPDLALQGTDTMLEMAISVITSNNP
ncbi:MAG: S41 family peptidase, partial [Muribaculaceae bacterium]|nr:S41 family peptidase [Muribaculaceae bacterium]